MKKPLKLIQFYNGTPTGLGAIRGLGQVIDSSTAEMHYDVELQLIGFRRRQQPGRPKTELTHFHPSGIAMVFDDEAPAAARKPKADEATL